jgi:hypothetical protein
MKDRMDFLQILSLLIAGAFLISAIMPASASTGTDGQTRIASILAARGVADTTVGHDFIGYTPGLPSSPLSARAIVSSSGIDRDTLLQDIRTGQAPSPLLLKESGLPQQVSDIAAFKNRSAILEDPLKKHQNITVMPEGSSPLLLQESGLPQQVSNIAAFKNRSAILEDLIRNHQGANSGVSRIFSGEGTVRFIDLEGGFYGIVTSSGERFIPDNLPRALFADGIPIRFTAMIGNQEPGISMWGRTIHLVSHEKIDRTISKEGTVRYVDLEGGFYGIITSTGGKYLPLNLDPEFRVDGLAVEFTARERQDISTTAMWGIPVELTNIRKLDTGSQSVPMLLEFSRNGGFAGCSDHLILYEDGSALVSRKDYATLVQVPEETLDRLAILLALVDGTDLQDEYPAPQEGADYYSYSLTIEGKTILMDETAVPDVLVPVIELLTDIIIATAPDDVIPPLFS